MLIIMLIITLIMTNNVHEDHDQKPIPNKQTENTFTVFHQNICGLNKREELLNSLTRNFPQIICITEHHLTDKELEGVILHSILWEPNFVDECTNVGVCVYLFRIISTILLLIWIDNPMKRT